MSTDDMGSLYESFASMSVGRPKIQEDQRKLFEHLRGILGMYPERSVGQAITKADFARMIPDIDTLCLMLGEKSKYTSSRDDLGDRIIAHVIENDAEFRRLITNKEDLHQFRRAFRGRHADAAVERVLTNPVDYARLIEPLESDGMLLPFLYIPYEDDGLPKDEEEEAQEKEQEEKELKKQVGYAQEIVRRTLASPEELKRLGYDSPGHLLQRFKDQESNMSGTTYTETFGPLFEGLLDSRAESSGQSQAISQEKNESKHFSTSTGDSGTWVRLNELNTMRKEKRKRNTDQVEDQKKKHHKKEKASLQAKPQSSGAQNPMGNWRRKRKQLDSDDHQPTQAGSYSTSSSSSSSEMASSSSNPVNKRAK